MGTHDIVKIELEPSYPYSDFNGWYDSLDTYEREVWVDTAKSAERSEHNELLLTKKAMELYCLEMGIDYIPNNQDYLNKILCRLTSNLVLASLIERGFVGITSGKLSFLGEPELFITERGKKFIPKKR